MSRSYNQWPQNNGLYSQQMDLGSYTSGDRQHRQQQQSQQPSTTFSNAFQFPQPSSSLQAAFGANTQHDQPPLQMQRGQSLGSSNSTQNGAYMQGVFNSNQPQAFPQNLSVNTTSYRADSSSMQYGNNALAGSGNLSGNNFLTASPGPMQEQFPPSNAPGLPQPQPSYYRTASITSGGSAPQAKRQRIPDRNLEEEHDGEISPEKEGMKKQYVLDSVSLFSF